MEIILNALQFFLKILVSPSNHESSLGTDVRLPNRLNTGTPYPYNWGATSFALIGSGGRMTRGTFSSVYGMTSWKV
jgi:hypothetical protein